MGNGIYERSLRLTGFEETEIGDYLPKWQETSEILGLTEADIEFAIEEWIPTHFDVSLEGVRKLLGCLIREIVDLTNANKYKQQGTKIVYGIMPAITHYYYALKLTAPDDIYVSFPDYFLTVVMNGLFHKLNPFLEEAEKSGIP